MAYKNTTELIDWLKKNNFWTNKSLGQNFLINPEIIKKIIEASGIKPGDNVVEVGPGPGILTMALLEAEAKVIAIELDDRLIPHLKEFQKTYPHLNVIHADALKTDLPPEPYKLVANIPYYITSPLISHYLQPKNPGELRPQTIVLLIQKEVAQKICAKDGDHSVLSLQVQIFGKPSIVDYVSKNNFFPAPKVDSAILKIDVYPAPAVEDIKLFFRLIKVCFAQRRKTLSNSLRSGINITKEGLTELLKKSNIEPTIRPQELSIQDWNRLIQNLKSLTTSL
ncbi:ribosomal RNA small subunit methyltransferase A [Candidatus Peregrinibacteria bacterium]|nr:ribosomal RNA small subunit methyltransferase A [Candidatus Peregrinibacteria bacterium]